MGRFTIVLLRRLSPEQRLIVSAYLFWLSIVGAIYCTLFLAKTPYERVLMFISWMAVTYTAWDAVNTTQVGTEVEDG